MLGSAEVPLAVAAARWGISPEALRKRVVRGVVPGIKHGGQWFVALPAEPDLVLPTPVRTPPDTASGQLSGQKSERPDSASLSVDRDALVARLEVDLAFVQESLAREQAANAELRRLLAGAQQQIAELVRALPPASPAEEAPTHAQSHKSPSESIEMTETTPTPESLAQALKEAGVKGKKTRRRLLSRLAAAWRGQ